MIRLIVVLILDFIPSISVIPEVPYSINTPIADSLFILEESTDIDPETIISGIFPLKFIPINDFKSTAVPGKTYWLKLITFLNSDIPAGLKLPQSIHRADIFVISDSGVYQKSTGRFVTGNSNHEIFPFSNCLKLEGSGNTIIYLRITNRYDENPDFGFKLVNIAAETKKNNRINIVDGFIHGLLWLMVIYGLLLYILHKDKLYLLYSGYIFFISLWYFGCLGTVYRLFPEFPRWLFPYTDIPGALSAIFYILFIRHFADTSRVLPGWDWFIRKIPVLLLALILFILIFLPVSGKIVKAYVIQGSVLMMVFITAAIMAVWLLRTKNMLAIITATGSLILAAGSLTAEILFLSTLDDNVLIIQKLSSVVELLIFTYGISYRYKLIELSKRKVQVQLIEQLKENADLQVKVNKELEEKVTERTLEITEKNAILEQQKNQIEIQNYNLTTSIHYAKRIQSALLPAEDFLAEKFEEYFILYKPLHIVSGDFYWFQEIDNLIIVVVGDCTGHGVPGAFMSILGVSLLTETISKSAGLNSDEILNNLRNGIIKVLHQTSGRNDTRDSIDLALCVIDRRRKIIQYSGGFRPLYHINNGILSEFRGDHMPIGIYDEFNQPFTRTDIPYQRGNVIYMFSDGFVDQIGGPNGKTLRSGSFKKMLGAINKLPLNDQKEYLIKIFEEWKGENEQVDDILVLGIRL